MTHKKLTKAVEKLRRYYIHATPEYREGGMAATVHLQNVFNGVPDEPFDLQLVVQNDELRIIGPDGEQEELIPGQKAAEKAYRKEQRELLAKMPYLEDKYTVRNNPNPQMDQQFEYSDIVQLPIRQVWTVVEGDTGKQLYAIPGCHFVNRLYCVVTEEEWTREEEEYKW